MSAAPLICVVDDDPSARDSLRELLEASDFNVESFSSAIHFLASEALTRCQCLITDVRMPEMDGPTLQGELNKRGHKFPVVVITGHGDVPLAVRAIKAGAIDFLEKPFKDEILLTCIQTALKTATSPPKANPAVSIVNERLAKLTDREREVLDLLVLGDVNKVIAQKLGISFRTVEIHRSRVLTKMEAQSIAELVRLVLAVNPDLKAQV